MVQYLAYQSPTLGRVPPCYKHQDGRGGVAGEDRRP